MKLLITLQKGEESYLNNYEDTVGAMEVEGANHVFG